MATSTVYPFGPGGETPSGIDIINDLVTGGADKALSAQQGVVLDEKISDAVPDYVKIADIVGDESKWAENTNTIAPIKEQTLVRAGVGSLFRLVTSSGGTKTTIVTITKDSSTVAKNNIFAIIANPSSNEVASLSYTFYNTGGSSVTTPSSVAYTVTQIGETNYALLHVTWTSTSLYGKVKVTVTYTSTGGQFVSAVCLLPGKKVFSVEALTKEIEDTLMNRNLKGEFDTFSLDALTYSSLDNAAESGWNTALESDVKEIVNPARMVYDTANSGGVTTRWYFTLGKAFTNLQVSVLLQDDGSINIARVDQLVLKNIDTDATTYYSRIQFKQISTNLYYLVVSFGAQAAGNYRFVWPTGNKLASRRWFNFTVTDNSMVFVDEGYLRQTVKRLNQLSIEREYRIGYLYRGKKICVYGASIDAQGGYWNKVATALAANVSNLAQGGGIVTWQSDFGSSSAEIGRIEKAWACTLAEKQAKLTEKGVDYTTVDTSEMNYAYDKSVLENLDADLYVIGVVGGNDQVYSEAYLLPEDNGYPTANPRNTVYGAISHVLNALYAEKPTAKVILMGSHELYHTHRRRCERCIQRVAEEFGIPYAKWSQYFNLNNTNHLEYCNDDQPHWNTSKSGRVAEAILKILENIKPYMTNP